MILSCQCISLSFGEKVILEDASFHIEDHEKAAMVGINGAGKSTTINILCTVLEKTSGNVKIGGYDLDKEKNKIKELIGIVFQGSVLDKQLTVKVFFFLFVFFFCFCRQFFFFFF